MQQPFRGNDLLLVLVVMSSMTVAIIYPNFGSLFQALPVYCVMANFFLSYLSIEFTAVLKALKGHSRQIMTFTLMKLVLLPIILYLIFGFFAPAYALSALLLTGVSTGVVAPPMPTAPADSGYWILPSSTRIFAGAMRSSRLPCF